MAKLDQSIGQDLSCISVGEVGSCRTLKSKYLIGEATKKSKKKNNGTEAICTLIMYICQKNLYPIQLPPFFGCSAMCSKEKNFLQECTVHTSTSRIQNPLYKAHDQLSTEGPSTSWRPTTTMSALRSTICSCSISSVKKSSIVTTQNEDSSSISRSSHGRDTDMVLSARSVSNKCVLADFFGQLTTGTLGTILTCMGAGIVGTGGDGAGALQFGSSGC